MANDSISTLFSTPEMDLVFSLANQLRQMTRFEWALSGALESAGMAVKGTAAQMEPLLDGGFVDVPRLLAQAKQAGNIAIPFVQQLTAAINEREGGAADSIHLGATSQDVLDTALMLQTREGLALILSKLSELDARLAQQARVHATTVMAGRTWLQDGPPTTLGLKIAGWVAALRRHRARIEAAKDRAIVLQFGGAVGTLAAVGEKGAEVSAEVARRLDLREPELPWHTHRDGLGEVACALGLLAGTLGKIARDVSLLMQTEVGEVFEPTAEGRGGSSTMPHKRNPVASAVILAAATREPGLVATLLSAMVQEHERGLGNWQAEWEVYPEIFRLVAAALERALEIADGMEVSPSRMESNLEATQGLAMAEAVSVALAASVGRDRAHRLIEGACQVAIAEDKHLRTVLLSMSEVRVYLSEEEIGRLLEPRNYLGSTARFIDRALGEPDAVRRS